MLPKASTNTSVSLTDIASLTAWTCNTVYDSTHYFFRDVDFEGADEGSDFPYGDDISSLLDCSCCGCCCSGVNCCLAASSNLLQTVCKMMAKIGSAVVSIF